MPGGPGEIVHELSRSFCPLIRCDCASSVGFNSAERKSAGETTALANFRGDCQFTVMSIYDVLDDCQPEPCAAGF